MEDGEIQGRHVVLRPATAEDRNTIYDWLARSDATASMMGPPTFPEVPVVTWEEFRDGYGPHFFDDSAPLLGRCHVILAGGEPVGQVNYNEVEERDGRRRTELDIWMRAEAGCGRGYGTDALDALCRHLAERLGVRDFMVQPSARNPRAIRAYEKAGFRRLAIPTEEARVLWGPSDYRDSVYMVRTISEADGAGGRAN